MAPAVRVNFPVVDAAECDVISDEAADFFRQNGLLVIRNVVQGEELAALQRETGALVDRVLDERPQHKDYFYREHEGTGEVVPFRVEYVIDKLEATKALLGHPFILRSVEKLQGPDFIPTWDSMVFKLGGAGAQIPWHRDGGLYEDSVPLLAGGRVFNVDFYLDEATMESCLWGLPGSNNWSEEEADAAVARLNDGGVVTGGDGMVPLPMQPGDVIFHNVLVLHGSAPTRGPLRRVIYYEFRPVDIELELGPHTPEYVAAKKQVLAAALRHRSRTPYAQDITPYANDITAYGNEVGLPAWDESPQWRFVHEEFWR